MKEGLSPFKASMNWYFAWWNLLIPEPLLPGLLRHLEENGEAIEDIETPCDLVEEPHVLDYPGMCMGQRHLHDISFGGITVCIPSVDFAQMFREIRDLPIKHEGGIPHVRLYTMVRCLCLTPELREQMLAEMSKQLQSAIEFADWEHRQLAAAFGEDKVMVCLNGRSEVEAVRKGFLLISPRPVLDREIGEA